MKQGVQSEFFYRNLFGREKLNDRRGRDIEKSILVSNQQIAINPFNDVRYEERAIHHYRNHNFPKALDDFNFAISKVYENALYFSSNCLVYSSWGNTELASVNYLYLLSTNYKAQTLHLLRYMLHRDMGNNELAIEDMCKLPGQLGFYLALDEKVRDLYFKDLETLLNYTNKSVADNNIAQNITPPKNNKKRIADTQLNQSSVVASNITSPKTWSEKVGEPVKRKKINKKEQNTIQSLLDLGINVSDKSASNSGRS